MRPSDDNYDYQKMIADTIRQQIRAIDPWALMAYGATNLMVLNENQMYRGGLSMKVRGQRFKGVLEIQLMYNDTYRVRTYNQKLDRVKDEVSDVYCDMLVSVLDDLVENERD